MPDWRYWFGRAPSGPESRWDYKLPEQEPRDFSLLRTMDGPYYRCDYLGYTAISKPPTGTNALQAHLKDLYLKYRRSGTGGVDASLKLIQQGIFITLFKDGQVSDELFFNFDTVNFIEAVKFAIVKNSSEKKPKAIFIPVDENKGPISDKHSFLLEKPFHFLTSMGHPPLVACVVRRPKGVKALDCHLFALDSIENALHITSLIGSAQTPPGYEPKVGQAFPARGNAFDSRGSGIEVDPRLDGSFNRGIRGDVVRPEYTDFSIYRGQPNNYETVGPPPQNEMMGGARLPPTNVQRNPVAGGPVAGGPVYHGHGMEAMVYGLYEQPRSHALIAGPMPRRHDPLESNVVLRRLEHNDNRSTTGNKSVSTGSEQSLGLRREEMFRNSNRLSADPTSSPRYQAVGNNDNRRYSPTANQLQQQQQHSSRSSTPVTSHVSSPRHDNPDFGPVYSASNLESRERVANNTAVSQEELSPEHYAGGKPIAKVPPHLRGIKVLPTDFRQVKLKPMEKRSNSVESKESSDYDNNNDIMQKYKALQESNGGADDSFDGHSRLPVNGNSRDSQESSVLRPDRHNKQDSSRHNRFSAPVYADNAPISSHWAPGGTGHHPSQSAYNMKQTEDFGNDTKSAEIANMFSNMGFQNGNSRRPQQMAGVDFEEGLGYLP